MSDKQDFGFGKFVPGFDFLQNLAKGASQNIPQMPNLANWVTPSLNVEELEKRLEELKAVHFWLEQNSRALGATIQALEVQKMTLSTLKGMNFNMGDVANALKLKAADSVQAGVQRVTDTASSTVKTMSSVASGAGAVAKSVGEAATGRSKSGATASTKTAKATGVAGLVDPLQLWGSLTQQFQQIAATAMKDAAKNTSVDFTRNMAKGLAKEAHKSAKGAATSAAKKIAGSAGGTRAAAKKTLKKKSSSSS